MVVHHLTIGLRKNDFTKPSSKPAMNIYPLSAMGTLSPEELLSAECSDRLYVPATVFQQHLQTRCVFLKPTNRVEQSTIGCMYAVHPNIGDSSIYAPQSIVERLDFDTEHITVESVTLPTCTQVTLQPFTAIEGLTMEQLQESLEQYSSITEDQVIRLWHSNGYEYEIKVQAVEPATTVSISNCDIPLSMMQPMCEDLIENTVVESVGETVATPVEEAVVEKAEETVTIEHPFMVTETVRERIYKAALARSQLQQSKPSDS
jgi:hypothetical protein